MIVTVVKYHDIRLKDLLVCFVFRRATWYQVIQAHQNQNSMKKKIKFQKK